MITGFSGHLISEQFLEQRIADLSRDQPPTALQTEFRQCRERQHWLGPASTVRALLESAAAPIVNTLGFLVVADVDILDDAAVATLRSDGGSVVIVVTNWVERRDRWWRLAVVEAGRRGASWCLLFNGTHLRLVNAVRVFSRRFVEFDLDCAADADRTFYAMRMLRTAEALPPPATIDDAHVDTLVGLSERHASDV